MKKILALLGIFSITASTTLFLTGCTKLNESKPDEKQDLSEVIENTNLIDLPNNDNNTILGKIFKWYKKLEGHIEVADTPMDEKATIKAKDNSTKYKGEVKVTYSVKSKPDEKQDLSEVIENTNLIDLPNDKKDTILFKILQWYRKLDGHIEVIGTPTDKKATIKAKADSNKYKGQIEVTYSVVKNEIKDLRDFIINNNRNLFGIYNNESQIIKSKFAEKCKIDSTQIDVLNIKRTSATIKAKDGLTKYKGEVNVTFYIRNLMYAIKETSLGKLNNDKLETILNNVKNKNKESDINIKELYVWSIFINNKNFTIIQAPSTSTKYEGIAIVTYSLKKV